MRVADDAPLIVDRWADVLLVGQPEDVVLASRLMPIPHAIDSPHCVQPLADGCERFGVGVWLPGYAYHASVDSWECPRIKSGLTNIGSKGLDVGVLLLGRTRLPHPRRQGDRAVLHAVWPVRSGFEFVASYALADFLLPTAISSWGTLWNESTPATRAGLVNAMWSVKVLDHYKQAWCRAGEVLLRHHALNALLPESSPADPVRL